MTTLLNYLTNKWKENTNPFMISNGNELHFSDLLEFENAVDLSIIPRGAVVSLIGDFNLKSIYIILKLIEKEAIIVPLTAESRAFHEEYFEITATDFVIEDLKIQTRKSGEKNSLISELKNHSRAGLVLFTSGTTGKPKAILHDFTKFLDRFYTPRPPLRTAAFLLFDHIGGINTLFHTLFNCGLIVYLKSRIVNDVLLECSKHQVELLPTTPTFLRMLLISGLSIPNSLKIITYGTERMDQGTLTELCAKMPFVDFRQTYGMSEIGILRVSSLARDSLHIKISGEGVELKVIDDVLHIKSASRMLGYLNEKSPFDEDGWFNTKDLVACENDNYKIIGRLDDVVNIGGLKIYLKEVEDCALLYPGVLFAKSYSRENPITGAHIELVVEFSDQNNFEESGIKEFLKERLPSFAFPRRILFQKVKINSRFKKN